MICKLIGHYFTSLEGSLIRCRRCGSRLPVTGEIRHEIKGSLGKGNIGQLIDTYLGSGSSVRRS
jgi:hypothetical protein